jgi:heat shock protein HslJ
VIDLRGTRWRVEDLAGQGLTGTASIEIAFGADGVLSGSTGVNRFRGLYRFVDDRLTIGPITTTRMAGPPEDWHRRMRCWRSSPGSAPFGGRARTSSSTTAGRLRV